MSDEQQKQKQEFCMEDDDDASSKKKKTNGGFLQEFQHMDEDYDDGSTCFSYGFNPDYYYLLGEGEEGIQTTGFDDPFLLSMDHYNQLNKPLLLFDHENGCGAPIFLDSSPVSDQKFMGFGFSTSTTTAASLDVKPPLPPLYVSGAVVVPPPLAVDDQSSCVTGDSSGWYKGKKCVKKGNNKGKKSAGRGRKKSKSSKGQWTTEEDR